MNKVTKLSTIVKRERVSNPVGYNIQRDKMLEKIVQSKPRMNITVVISSKQF